MNKTMLAISAKIDKMSKSEKQIAEWLIEHPSDILPLSITELAEICSCSEATVSRFSKRLGFSGYQGLKISLAQETGSEKLNTDLEVTDNAKDIYDKVSNNIYLTLEKTKHTLDFDKLEKVSEIILKAERIVIFGLGNSAPIALDASHKFTRIGINANAYSDGHIQAIIASHLSKNDLAIGISHSGSSMDIVNSINIAKSMGATTVGICNTGKSPLSKCCDIALTTFSDETDRNILALSSRIAQLAIIDTLYYYLINNNQTLQNAIRNTEKALIKTKY